MPSSNFELPIILEPPFSSFKSYCDYEYLSFAVLKRIKEWKDTYGEWMELMIHDDCMVDATDQELRSLGFIPNFLQERTAKEVLAFLWIKAVEVE